MGEAVFAFEASEAATFECALDGGAPEVAASPRSYAGLGQGPHTFSVVAIDAAGNRDASAATATWTVVLPPVHTLAYAERGLVAHVGEPLAAVLPVGSVWTDFGVPAINDAGDVVFIGKWTHPAGKGEAVFVKSPTTGDLEIIIQRGSPPPPDSSLPPDATIKALKDPLLAPNGDVLTPVTLAGTGITSANDAALIWSPRSNIAGARIVVREGDPVDGAATKAFKGTSIMIKGMTILTDSVAFTAILTGAGVTSANDFALCAWDEAEGLRLLAREGQVMEEGTGFHLVSRPAAPGERTLKSFKTLIAATGAPGQGRGMHGATAQHQAGMLAKFSDGSSAVMSVDALGEATVYSASGSSFKSYGIPAWGAGFASPVFFATPTSGAKGIFQCNDATGETDTLIRVGDDVAGVSGATVKSLLDPVLSTDATRKGWNGAIMAGGIVSGRAIWQKADTDDESEILARTGTQAAEAPAGALWGAFKSLAMPARGALLSATLTQGAGGVNGSNDAGLWAVDGEGALRLLFREGDTIGGKVLKSFIVLKAVSGSPGVTRAFNDNGQIVWRATFTGGSTAIVVTTVP